MTNKDKAEVTADPFAFNEQNIRDFLCGPIERYMSTLEDAKKKMVNSNVPSSIIARYFAYDPENTLLMHHNHTLEQMTNPRTGKFWSLESLKHDISPEQAEVIRMQDNYRERPYYYIYQIRKVEWQNQEFLVGAFLVEGLTRESGAINDSGYIGIDKIPRFRTTFVSPNPENKNARQVQVTEYNDTLPVNSFDGAINQYTIPWDPRTFYAMLMHTEPVLQNPNMDLESVVKAVNENKDKVALSFHKEGVTDPSAIGIDTVEQFISESVDAEFNKRKEWESKKSSLQRNFSMTDIDEYIKWKTDQQKKKANEEKEPYN